MPAVTTQEILDRARAIADMEESNFVSPTVWMQWMNQANKQLALMIARFGYVQDEATSVVTANGSVAYSITQPLAVIGVFEKDTNGRVRRLEAMGAIEGYQYLGGPAVPGRANQWRATATKGGLLNLSLFPSPTSGTYLVVTVKQPDKLVLTDPQDGETDEVLYPMGWEEWIVLEMAKRAQMKEEGDVRGILTLQKQVEQHVEENSWSRALNDAPTVRDSRRPDQMWSNALYYGAPEYWRFI